jgi:hypothetical protein
MGSKCDNKTSHPPTKNPLCTCNAVRFDLASGANAPSQVLPSVQLLSPEGFLALAYIVSFDCLKKIEHQYISLKMYLERDI